jgi:zinc transporter, ZIP family
MLAETMIPEAYLRGGKVVGLVTTLGFGVAFAASALE